MVIIKFGEKRVIERKRFFKTKKIEEDYFLRFNEIVNNKLFTVIETSFDINNPEILRLVKSNRGQIFTSNNIEFNSVFKDYLIDVSQYLKKAYYSAFYEMLKNSKTTENVFIEDNSFTLCDEVYRVASACKKLTVIGLDNRYLNEFKSNCFYNYGLNVLLNSYLNCQSSTSVIHFNKEITEKGIDIIFNSKEIKLLPAKEYFDLKEEYRKFLTEGVSLIELCVAVNT